MSEITLKYRMTLDDLVMFNYSAASKKALLLRTMSFSIAVIWAVLFFAFENYKAIPFAVIFLIFGIAYPFILRYEIKKKCKSNFSLDKEFQLEFYNDHIIERCLPTNEGDFNSELHVPFEKIRNITETDDLYLFFINQIEAVGIMKRTLTQEDSEKISNLIENVFSDRYTTIKTKKSNNKRG